MYIPPEQKNIFLAFILSVLIFSYIFVVQKNTEFIGYVVIVILLLLIILYSNKYVHYPNYCLWLLFSWAVLHMLGGVEMGNGKVFYTLMLYPFVGEPYNILKYDQVVHAFGFFSASLAVFYALSRYLVHPFGWFAVGIAVAMAGEGLGAVNEIVEFLMTVFIPNTNVGGYVNNSLDLIFNLSGAVLAVLFLRWRFSKEERGKVN